MSWFRILVLLALVPSVGACGFRPLYDQRQDAAVTADLAAIQINVIADREGQKLHNFLLDRLNSKGPAATPLYRLRVTLTTDRRSLALRKDETATRVNLTLTAKYLLRDLRTAKVLFEGRSRATNSYNILQSEFATLASLDDATTQAARELSDEIKTRLAIFLSQRRNSF